MISITLNPIIYRRLEALARWLECRQPGKIAHNEPCPTLQHEDDASPWW